MKDLIVPGLHKGIKWVYKNGENFQIVCTQGFVASTENNGRLECENGAWIGPTEPCVEGKVFLL